MRRGGAGGRFGGGGATPFDPIEVPPSLLRWLDAGGGGAPPAARSESGDEDGAWESDEGPSEGESDGGQELPPPPAPEPATEAVAQLEDMGFPSALARKALQLRADSVPAAAEWLLAHADDPGAGAPLTEEELRRIAGPSRGTVRRQARERWEASRRREADAGAVRQLTEMGFEEARAHRALRATGNSVELACQLLLQGSEPPLVARAEPRREPAAEGAHVEPGGNTRAPPAAPAGAERRLHRLLQEGLALQDLALRREARQRGLHDSVPDAQGGGEGGEGGGEEGGEHAPTLNFSGLLRLLEAAGVGDDTQPPDPRDLLRILRAAGAGDGSAARGFSGAGAQPSDPVPSSAAEGSPSANSPTGEGGAGDVEGAADAP